MKKNNNLRYVTLALVLFLGLLWSLVSASQQENSYPNSRFVAYPYWLKAHMDDTDLVIADVRTDDHFDGALIPGAIRLPWSMFQHNDIGNDVASTFTGISRAQEILGRHGITPKDTIVLYDSVERDGGATNADIMARAHLMMESDIPKFMLMAVILSAIGLLGLETTGVANTRVLPTSLVARHPNINTISVVFPVFLVLVSIFCSGCPRPKKDKGTSLKIPRGYVAQLDIQLKDRLLGFGPFVEYYFKPEDPEVLTRLSFDCFNEDQFYTRDLPENSLQSIFYL